MMKNRYGNEYSFVKTGDNEYTIKGELDHWRFGGREGVEGLDINNLGFVDPSGGPFISVNEYFIEGRKVTNIASTSEGIFFTVEADND
jgi:hypothetical protein